MCRWLAYSGSSLLLEELLYVPAHSLIDQSLHSRLGATTTNGDGFGVGWYGEGGMPAVFHSTEPAWNDRNLRELAAHVRSQTVFAHIRASTGTADPADELPPVPPRPLALDAQRRHPRVRARQAGTHAGRRRGTVPGAAGLDRLRALLLSGAHAGLEDDPPAAVARAVGLIEQVGAAHGVAHPIQMTVATTDGASVWGFRYSSEGQSRSLFYSTSVDTLKHQYPDNPLLRGVGDEARLIVSEPLGDLRARGTRCRSRATASCAPAGTSFAPFAPQPWAARAQAVAPES